MQFALAMQIYSSAIVFFAPLIAIKMFDKNWLTRLLRGTLLDKLKEFSRFVMYPVSLLCAVLTVLTLETSEVMFMKPS